MSDRTVNSSAEPIEPASIADILAGVEPMGDLGRYAIDDLTADEEDEFFRILADS